MSFNVLDISGYEIKHFTQINNSLNNGLSPDYSFYGGINDSFNSFVFVKYANCVVEDIIFGNNSTNIQQYQYSGSTSTVDVSLGYLTTDLSYTKFNNYTLTDMTIGNSNIYACGYVNDSDLSIDRGIIFSFDFNGNVNQTFTGGIEGISGYFVMDTSNGTIASRYTSIYIKNNNIIVGGIWTNNPDPSNSSILLQSITYDASFNTSWGFPNGTSESLIPYNYKEPESGFDLSGLIISNLTSYSQSGTDPIIFFANVYKNNKYTPYAYKVNVNSSDTNYGAITLTKDISNTGLPDMVGKRCIDNWLTNDGSIYVSGDHNVEGAIHKSWYVAQLDSSFQYINNFGSPNGYVKQPDISGTLVNYIQLIPGSSSTVINNNSIFVSLFDNINNVSNNNKFTLLDLSGVIETDQLTSIANDSGGWLSVSNNNQIVVSNLDDNVSGTLQDDAIHLYECGDGLRIVQIGAYINSKNPSIASNLLAPRIAPICFQKGTKIQCDQGIIKIENIIPNQHTIKGKSINFVTKTIHTGDTLIKFKKDCFAPNRPSEDLICSPEHKIYFKNKLVEAKDFVDSFVHVIKIKNKKEVLYNILMDNYEIIIANNITVESLHPNNLIAVLNSNYNNKEIKDLCLKKIGNINNYNKNVKKINEPKKVKLDIIKRNKNFN
jgi:hypothetical protein|uniref:Hedgehog/Intein (Hint) domain-containing protein n=1 Tax=viral metagenome TaxID=1070528 RepID=A0A6C0CX74_9ZZZZ